jgi:hypothetical protein
LRTGSPGAGGRTGPAPGRTADDETEGLDMVGVAVLLADIGPGGDRFGSDPERMWPQWLVVAAGAAVALAVGRIRRRAPR